LDRELGNSFGAINDLNRTNMDFNYKIKFGKVFANLQSAKKKAKKQNDLQVNGMRINSNSNFRATNNLKSPF